MGGYQPSSAHQSVSYVSAHDNYTLWDKLVHTLTDSMEPDFGAYNEVALAQNRLAAGIYFTCLGITFYRRERKRRVRNTVTTTAIAPRRR